MDLHHNRYQSPNRSSRTKITTLALPTRHTMTGNETETEVSHHKTFRFFRFFRFLNFGNGSSSLTCVRDCASVVVVDICFLVRSSLNSNKNHCSVELCSARQVRNKSYRLGPPVVACVGRFVVVSWLMTHERRRCWSIGEVELRCVSEMFVLFQEIESWEDVYLSLSKIDRRIG